MLITFLFGIYRDVTSWETLLPPTFFLLWPAGRDFLPSGALEVAKETPAERRLGVPTAGRHRGRMFAALRLQCKRSRSGRESVRRGLGRFPPSHPVPSSSHKWPTGASGWVGRSPSTSAERRRRRLFYVAARVDEAAVLPCATTALLAAASACGETSAHLLLASVPSRYFSGLGDVKVGVFGLAKSLRPSFWGH